MYSALWSSVTSAAFCITDSTKWKGDIRHTVSGKTCQAWVLDIPHQHHYHDKTFPDGSEAEAENFCRDPMGEGQPWCYTVDPDVRWEFCPVPHCTCMFVSFYTICEFHQPRSVLLNNILRLFLTVIFLKISTVQFLLQLFLLPHLHIVIVRFNHLVHIVVTFTLIATNTSLFKTWTFIMIIPVKNVAIFYSSWNQFNR